MNRCPTCQRIFSDETISYCLEDGTALLRSTGLDSERTLALGNEGVARTGPAPTEFLDPAGAPTLPASPSLTTIEVRDSRNDARPAAPVREPRSTRLVVVLTVIVTTLLLGLSGLGAWMLLKDGNDGPGGGNGNSRRDDSPNPSPTVGNANDNSGGIVSTTPSPTPTPETTPSPEEPGYISGPMAYPSDAIPGVMVVCAENLETKDTVCSSRRKDWEAGVKYNLKLPPGRYYLYGTLLPGDDSVGGMRGMKAYYTEYMKCGMGENCNSHRRIIVEVQGGESLSGITVGDWWASP